MEIDRVYFDNSVVRFFDFDIVKYDFYDEELENFDYVVWLVLFLGNLQLIVKGVVMVILKVRQYVQRMINIKFFYFKKKNKILDKNC